MARQFLTPLRLPSMSTTDRDALTAGDGDEIYNSTLQRGELRANGLWVPTSGLLGGSIGLWQFATSTVDSDPGPGVLRLNNATQPSATEIRFDPVDLSGVDLSTMMQYLYGGSGSDVFKLQSIADPTKFIQGVITGYDIPTGYFKFFITVLSHSGTFTAGEILTLTGSRAGAAGANGTDGVTGFGLAGDGSDGVINFDGTNTRLGLAPSSGAYSLTRDIYLADGSQISGSAVIKTRNFRIFCSGTLTVGASASIIADGGAGNNAAAGAGTGSSPSPFYAASGNGGAGHPTGSGAGAGTAGTAVTSSVGGAGGAGGIASGSGTGGGTAGATAAAPAANDGTLPRNYVAAVHGYFGGSGAFLRGGAGGSGGSNATSSTGGGGGGGGGIVLIVARVLVNNGTVTSKGGAGGNGSGAGTGAGGGGGGGGGAVMIVCGSSSTIGTLTVTGGAGGARQGVGANGAAGSAGQTFTLNL